MGIGEWETVMTMQQRNPGHYWNRKPLWGYINEADPAVMSMEIEQATRHGVNVFIFDWYWFDGRPFMETTLNNLRANGGRIAVSVYDAKTLEGYQIKGRGEYVTQGDVVDAYKAMVEQVFHGAATAKGALLITPEQVIVTTPGSDNKKVL